MAIAQGRRARGLWLEQALHRTAGAQLNHQSERGVEKDDYADASASIRSPSTSETAVAGINSTPSRW